MTAMQRYETAIKHAVQEYNERKDVSLYEMAIKYGVRIKDLHHAYIKIRAQQ